MTGLVDAHAHLHGPEFDADRPEVLARARAAGVCAIVTAGTDVATSASAVALAEAEPAVWATVGIHPHEAGAAVAEDLARLREFAAAPRVVAVGEIGLDYHYDLSPREIQRRLLQQQLDLADDLHLPAVIHSRDAEADTFALLAAWSARRRRLGVPEPYGVMHCYAYGAGRLAAYLDLRLLISIAGIVTYPRADEVRQAVLAVDPSHYLLETDCPYLAPQSRRGRRNEPALLTETAARVASLRGVDLETVAQQSTETAVRLFRLSGDATGANGPGETSAATKTPIRLRRNP